MRNSSWGDLSSSFICRNFEGREGALSTEVTSSMVGFLAGIIDEGAAASRVPATPRQESDTPPDAPDAYTVADARR
jgi:hypothetical protein